MTNESISGFLNSIAEAKRAFDAEPQYQRQISELELERRRLGETIATRELRIHELKQVETELTAKLRSVEAERDDAGFRHLEADDKVQSLLKLVHGVIGDALKAVSAVEGKESIVINKVDYNDDLATITMQEEEIVGLRQDLDRLHNDMHLAQEQLTRPFAPTPDTSFSADVDKVPLFPRNWEEPSSEMADWDKPWVGQSAADPIPASGSDPAPRGQSEADPTSSFYPDVPDVIASEVQSSPASVVSHRAESEGPFAGTTLSSQSETATSATAEPSADVASHGSAPERNRDESTRFLGRKYYDVTYFVPKHEWLAKGGTEENYDWRPAPLYPQPNRASHNS